MTYQQGISFRATSTFVTDVSPSTYEIGTNTNYPRTTPQGNTVGWENPGPGNTRDRTTSNDARIAGCHFPNTSAGSLYYRFDLPSAGSYNVRFASGDPSSSGNATAWTLVDGTTVLTTLTTGTQATANTFKDATNAVLTAANWPGSNTAYTATFSTTICRFRSDSNSNNMISHAYVEAAGGGSGVSVALTGQSTSAAQGALGVSHTQALTGNSGASAQGTVGAGSDVSASLTGQQIGAAQGTVGVAKDGSVTLAGQQLLAGQGSVAASISASLTGQQSGTSAGNLAPTSQVGLSGQSAAAQQGAMSIPGDVTVAITGQSLLVMQGSVSIPISAAGGYGGKKYVVRKGARLLVFSRQADAIAALQDDEKPNATEPKAAPKKAAPKPAIQAAKAEQVVSLAQIKQEAKAADLSDQYERLLRLQQYEQLIALYERLQEEEEDEWLLMSA